ncbi:MAG: hypothetical protein MPJ50_05000 [Pirellulales bacterium]|nr:hypothetical protein [Pirellulales bacterium]
MPYVAVLIGPPPEESAAPPPARRSRGCGATSLAIHSGAAKGVRARAVPLWWDAER